MGTKGIPKRCKIGRDEFYQALYNPDKIVTKNFTKMGFNKKLGGITVQNLSKKSLNSSYSKLYVHSNLVQCTPWDTIKK